MDTIDQGLPDQALSRREHEILCLLAQGLSDRDIAEQLVVARTTVKWHNRQIFKKLGVDNRRQAVAQATQLGLLAQTNLRRLPKNNLPAPLTPFVGRGTELEALTTLLGAGNSRLVTVVAPGGMGKTRLALAAAEAVLAQFADGVFVVPLAALTTAEALVAAIATAISFPMAAEPRPPRQQLLEGLQAKCQLLLLDNFEQLLGAADLVIDILRSAPQVTILVTSREKLNVDGEWVYRLGAMHYPDRIPSEPLLSYDAVNFFIQCAQRTRPQWGIEDESSLIRICQLVQGMPLAILLAAAWLDVLSLAEIALEISTSADFLQSELQGLPERQRSIRAIFDHAWRRLDSLEQQTFAQLSLFQGGFSRQAAESVTGAPLAVLKQLVNQALLERQPDGRYRIHELLRQFGEAALQTSGDWPATRHSHADYFGAFLAQHEDELIGGQQLQALRAIEDEFDNVVAGWRWAVTQRHYATLARYVRPLRLFRGLRRTWGTPPLFTEARRELSDDSNAETQRAYWQVVASEVLPEVRVEPDLYALLKQGLADAVSKQDRPLTGDLLYALAHCEMQSGDQELARTHLAECSAIRRWLGDDAGLANVCLDAAYIAGEDGLQQQYTNEALALYRKIGNRFGQQAALNNLGSRFYLPGNEARATAQLRESLTLGRDLEDQESLASPLLNLSTICCKRGQVEQAQQYVDEALSIARTVNSPYQCFDALHTAWRIAVRQEAYAAATTFAQEALLYAQQSGYVRSTIRALSCIGLTAALHGEATAPRKLLDALALAQDQAEHGGMAGSIAWVILGLSFYFSQRAYYQRAAELLALALSNPLFAWFFETFPVMLRHQTLLEQELGTTGFKAALLRGKLLEIEEVTAALLSDTSFPNHRPI